MYHNNLDTNYFNKLSKGHFSGLMGIEVTRIEEGRMLAEMSVKKEFFAPNGYIHAGSIVTFADTIAGYATVANLPENGKLFTTLELKSNFTKAIRVGTMVGECHAEHMGRTTQVWRVIVRNKETEEKLAIFSCTQLILY